MLLVKALCGSFLGGLIGAVIAEATTQQFGTQMPWAILLAGLLGGVGTRLACRRDRTFSTGLIAALATILAISGVSYVMSSSASKTAKRSMDAIPVRTDLDERIVKERKTDSDALVDDSLADKAVHNEDGRAEELASTDTNKIEEASDAEMSGEGTAELADYDRPAEMEASTDAWVAKVADHLIEEDASSPMQSNSFLLFYLMSGLVAFVLGSGSGAMETAPEPATTEASDQTN
ncbi:hypothetical protein [Neorhodopirellula lusitana]|uniref:hypothetical protein n=1 Tax=Neorhodopirellula lusitana TaxID=445327 RepID=UPI00384B9233